MAQRPPLTTEDRLLLSQVIYEYGALDWMQVSTRFVEWSTHRGKPALLNHRECEMIWTALMQQMKASINDPTFIERTRMPRSPINLELVKGLFRVHLTEIHQQILERENAYQTISKEIEEILSGAWDDKIIPKMPQPETVAPPTASSSSSQLSSIDSPTPAKPTTATTDKTKDEESPSPYDDEKMEVDERDITIRQEDSMDMDDVIADIPEEPAAPIPAKEKAKETKTGDMVSEDNIEEKDEDAEGEGDGDGEDAEGEDDQDVEKEDVPPARATRSSRRTLEPLEIPANTAGAPKSPRKTRGRGVSDAQPPLISPTTRRRRHAPEAMTKGPQSPTTASVADTMESAATPVAATDENVSVADKEEVGGSHRRRSSRAHIHKRKASEMDVDLPPPTLKVRDQSATIEEEPMTPAVPVSGGSRVVIPRTRQAMFQMVQLLTGSKNAEIFQKPVTKKDAPDYAQAVLRPTDLSTIQKAIRIGGIVTWEELERDLTKMLANSCVYNKPGTDAYESARLMLKEVEENLEAARESTNT